MTAHWNKRLHAELAARNIKGENKESLIDGFTKGRTGSAKDLTDAEARELIDRLPPIAHTSQAPSPPQSPQGGKREGKADGKADGKAVVEKVSWSKPDHNSPENTKRRRLFAMAYGIWGVSEDTRSRIKTWCETMGAGGTKRKFNEYTSAELSKLIGKFQKVIDSSKI